MCSKMLGRWRRRPKEARWAKKSTLGDAQLILQLYDLRREAEMRKSAALDADGIFAPERERFHESRDGVGVAGE